jgi:hypothetical protein
LPDIVRISGVDSCQIPWVHSFFYGELAQNTVLLQPLRPDGLKSRFTEIGCGGQLGLALGGRIG